MNLGMPEMIFIFLLALVLFGPKKLPELGRQLGKFLAEFKKASNQFKNQIEVEMMNIELEERARQAPPPDSPKILPGENLYETTGVPPFESVPRAPLASLTEGQPVEAPESQPLVVDLQPQVPNLTSVAPTRNA